MKNFSSLLTSLLLAVAVLGLSACGSSSSSNSGNSPTADAFTTQVSAIVATSEDADIVETDSITVTTSETSEPIPII